MARVAEDDRIDPKKGPTEKPSSKLSRFAHIVSTAGLILLREPVEREPVEKA